MANKELWVIGDNILNQAAGHYEQFKVADKTNGTGDKNTLYMEHNYYVKRITSGEYQVDYKTIPNIPAMLLGNLVETLNEPRHAKVPHTIVIILNDYRFWNNKPILQNEMGEILRKFIKELKSIMEARNYALPEKAADWNNPRIFITRALPLPNNMTKPYPKGFRANRRRFNRLLQKGADKGKYKMINLHSFTCENKNQLFNEDGRINDEGYRELWIAVNDAIHKEDVLETVLLRKLRAKKLAQEVENQTELSDSDSESQKPVNKSEKKTKQGKSPVKRSLNLAFTEAAAKEEAHHERSGIPSHSPRQINHVHQKPNHHKQPGRGRRGNYRGFPGPYHGFYPPYMGPYAFGFSHHRGHFKPY